MQETVSMPNTGKNKVEFPFSLPSNLTLLARKGGLWGHRNTLQQYQADASEFPKALLYSRQQGQ